MGRTIGSNNQQNYNVSNVFNDYDAFCCNTPTTYYKINQFAFVSHTNKNCDVPADELTRSNADTPPFADYENNDPFSQHQMQHQPSPLRISIPRQVMGPIKASVFNQGAAASLNMYNNQKVLASQLKLSRPPVQAIPQASYNVENDEQEDEEEEATEALNSQDDHQQVEVQEAPVAQQKPIVMTIAAPQQATPAKKAVVAEEEDEEFVEKEDDEEDYQQEDEDEEDDDEDFVEEKVEKPTRATKNSNKKASKKAAKKTPVKTRKDDKPVAASSSVAAASSAHQQEGPIQVTIKPARKTRSNFISFFPEKLYCAPYKYDVRVRFSASESHEKYNNMIESGDYQTLLFKLLDGETHKPIKSNSKGDKALTVEKCKKSDLMNEEGEDHDDQAHHANEVVYRLCFNVCSFHNHRKPFVIQCTEKNSELLLFESNPFHIYARKNNKDKNGSDQWGDEVPAESVKTLFSGLENEEQTAGSEDAMDSKEEDNEKTVTASKRSREEDGNSDEKKSSKKKQKTLRIQLPAQFQKQAGEFSNVE